jgi:hypothetical protein
MPISARSDTVFRKIFCRAMFWGVPRETGMQTRVVPQIHGATRKQRKRTEHMKQSYKASHFSCFVARTGTYKLRASFSSQMKRT